MQSGAALHLCLLAEGNSSYHQAQIQNLRETSHFCGPVVPKGRYVNKKNHMKIFKTTTVAGTSRKQLLKKKKRKEKNILQATNWMNSQDSQIPSELIFSKVFVLTNV